MSDHEQNDDNEDQQPNEVPWNPEHLERLNNVSEFNAWRSANQNVEVNLRGADLRGENLSGAKLWRANLSGADLSKAQLNDAILIDADLSGANLSGARLDGANLINANLTGAKLVLADLSRAKLSKAKLNKADMNQAELNEANLNEAKLCKAKLWKANLIEASLSGADLSGANLRFANLTGAALDDADLSGADLHEADLSGANLSDANLSEAKLSDANLSEAKLFDANLSGGNLIGADLSGANLSDANLSEAKLFHVDLSKAQVLTGEVSALLRLFPFYDAPFILNHTTIERTRFAKHSGDPWNVIRRAYSGPKFALIAVLFLAFLTPYIAATIFWVSVHYMERAAVQSAVSTVAAASEKLKDSEDSEAREWAKKTAGVLKTLPGFDERVTASQRRLHELEKVLHEAAELTADNDPEAKRWKRQAQNLLAVVHPAASRRVAERQVWQLLLGWDKGFVSFLLVIVAVVYNVGRGWLTLQVSILRDEEVRAFKSPGWDEYRRLWKWHQFLSVILIIAFVSFAITLWQWMTLPVLVVSG